jgi:hypothetical protein
MEPKPLRIKGGPEAKIQAAIMAKLMRLGWWVVHLHASVYMVGMPDLFATHNKYGVRLIEVKDPSRRGNIFTPAQLKNFPELVRNGSPIWVLTSDADSEIAKLMNKDPKTGRWEGNWWQFLQVAPKG